MRVSRLCSMGWVLLIAMLVLGCRPAPGPGVICITVTPTGSPTVPGAPGAAPMTPTIIVVTATPQPPTQTPFIVTATPQPASPTPRPTTPVPATPTTEPTATATTAP